MDNFIESDIVFVSDMFLEDYGGGAERTTEALFEVAPYKTFKLKSSEVTQELYSKVQVNTGYFLTTGEWTTISYR